MSSTNSTTSSEARRKFTRIPKATELIEAGVPLYAFPTYHALSDHADNRTGETRVSVVALAGILKVSRRTVERHIRALEKTGVIKHQRQRRTRRGRFSSCLRVIISFALFASSVTRTVRHWGTDRSRRAKDRTKPYGSAPQTPQGASREDEEKRRWRGYEWLRDS